MFSITKRILGETYDMVITEEEHELIKESRRCLSASLAIEEKYDILLSNYYELVQQKIREFTHISTLVLGSNYSQCKRVRPG